MTVHYVCVFTIVYVFLKLFFNIIFVQGPVIVNTFCNTGT